MNLAPLFFLFLITTLIEIYVLIAVGSVIGGFFTIVLILLTAFIGAYLFKYQGLSTLKDAQLSAAQGIAPTTQIMEGVIILICGVLLLTPGFVTDAIGFLGLVPYTRKAFVRALMSRNIFASNGVFTTRTHQARQDVHQTRQKVQRPGNTQSDITDAEYWKE